MDVNDADRKQLDQLASVNKHKQAAINSHSAENDSFSIDYRRKNNLSPFPPLCDGKAGPGGDKASSVFPGRPARCA